MATDGTGVAAVSYTHNNSAARPVRGTGRWIVRSRPGRNRLAVTATDAAGNVSQPAVARVVRR